MEKFVQIIQSFPYQERDYTDRNGQQQTFASRGFVLTDGIDQFYAEMTGDYARNMKDVHPDTNILHRVQLVMSTRAYQDKEGNTRFSNEIRIVKIG